MICRYSYRLAETLKRLLSKQNGLHGDLFGRPGV